MASRSPDDIQADSVPEQPGDDPRSSQPGNVGGGPGSQQQTGNRHGMNDDGSHFHHFSKIAFKYFVLCYNSFYGAIFLNLSLCF